MYVTIGSGGGLFGGDDRVVYWKCEAGQTLEEKLVIPIANKVKEKALLLAAQQVSLSWHRVISPEVRLEQGVNQVNFKEMFMV